MAYFVECAGGCGKTLHGSATSLPAGQRTCRPCRKAGRGPRNVKTRDCPVCLTTFEPCDHLGRPQLTCSRRCGAASRMAKVGTMERPRRPCGDCDTVVTWPRVYCAHCGSSRKSANNQRKNLRRRAGGGQPMTIAELGERDRWRCHLCNRRVDPAVRWPDPRSGSRDHLVPVADGGTNDSPNLALAHLGCNVRRGTGGTVQLQLVG